MNILLLKTTAFFVMMVFLYFLVHLRYTWLGGRDKYHLDNMIIDAFARTMKGRVAKYREAEALEGSYLMRGSDTILNAIREGDVVDAGISAAEKFLLGEKTMSNEDQSLVEAYSDAFKGLMLTLSVGGHNEGLVNPEEAAKAIQEGIDMLVAPLTEAFVEKLRLEAELGALKSRLKALPDELFEKLHLDDDHGYDEPASNFNGGVMKVIDAVEEAVACINDPR